MTNAQAMRPGSWNMAALVIHSDFMTHAQITEKLELEDSHPDVEHRSVAWTLRCPLDEQTKIEDHITWILDFVEAHADTLRAMIGNGAETRVQAAISDDSGQYPMTFDADLLQRFTTVPIDLWLTAWQPGPHVPGKGKGRFRVKPDFDEPLPDELIDLFEARSEP
jgi:hypothetical protein